MWRARSPRLFLVSDYNLAPLPLLEDQMKVLTLCFFVFLSTHALIAQLSLRDDFNRPPNADLGASPSPYKWVKLSNQPNASASLQINSDMTISPINTIGVGNFGGVAWDSLCTDTTQVGLIVKQKGGNGSNSSFFIYFRMKNKDLSTGNGYRLQYIDNPSSSDQIVLQRVTSGTNGVALVTRNREIAVGDTLLVKVEANKTMKVLVYGANGVRDSISVIDNTYNPSQWYCWLRGCVFTTSVRMDNFMVGRIFQPSTTPKFLANPTSLSFGSVDVGSGKTDSVKVTNTGGGQLVISSVGSDNPQFTVAPASANISSSGSQQFYVAFQPTDTSLQRGKIIFVHNQSGGPDTVAVTGNGKQRRLHSLTMQGYPCPGSPSSGNYPQDTCIVINAPPLCLYGNAGRAYFYGWTGIGTGSYTGSNDSAIICMNADITETPHYAT